jgi:hypothetical protein
MEIYRDLSRPAARSEQDNGGGKIGENKENIEHHDDAQQPHNARRTMSMAGRPRGLRERRITSPQQGEPNSMGEKGDPVEVSQRTVLEDVTHRYNSSYEETMDSDEESMMDTSSRETALQENATPPQRQTRHLSSHPYRGGSPRFTRNMR